jgi:putative ABC transport system substrate-binding protein
MSSRSSSSILGRRQFTAALGAAAAFTIGPPVWAQARRPARIGFIGGGGAADSESFLTNLPVGLAKLGYDRSSFSFIERFAEQKPELIQGLVAELEAASVDLIVTHAAAVLPVVRAKRVTPVVYNLSADPVSVGLTTELSRPENNATGLTLMAAELNGKRLELLREIGPERRRVSVLYNPLHGGEHLERAWIDERAKALGFDVAYHPASNLEALNRALAANEAAPPDAFLLLSDGFMHQQRGAAIQAALRLRVPVIAGWAVFAESGALCSYGPRIPEMVQRTAFYVDRILRGAKPADLPIERPNTFELLINLDTAAQLGLNLSPTLIARADRVIG